jgi:hypothetical protein
MNKPTPPLDLIPISIRAALAAPPLVHTHILPGLIPGSVGSLVGPGGSSKTTLAIQIAVARALALPVAHGLFPALDAPLRVALLSAEDPKYVFCDRLRTIVPAELEIDRQLDLLTHSDVIDQIEDQLRVYSLAGQDARIVRGKGPTPALRQIIASTKDCDLVILETVSRLHDGDENAASDMSALVSAAERLAKETGAAVLLIHHSSKAADYNGRGDSQHAARGSSAFVDNVRWVGNLFPLSEDEAARLGVPRMRRYYVRSEITKANFCPPQPASLLRRHDGGVLKFEGNIDDIAPMSRRTSGGAR